jgi:hypothetical protein
MINTEKIEELIDLTITSGYVKDNEAPISLILIANPESGKSKMLEQIKNKHSIEVSDISSKGITDVIIPLLEKNKLHHIIVPDFIKVISHKTTTTDATMAFFNSIMEEGIKRSIYFGQLIQLRKKQKCGLITSITFDYYYKIFRKWHDIGFLSRFLPVSFTYSQNTIDRINHAIARNEKYETIHDTKTIVKQNINIPNDISDKLNFLLTEIVSRQKKDSIRVKTRGGKIKTYHIELYGFRLHKQLRKLLKSIALKEGRDTVNWSDMSKLQTIIDYIRLPKNPKEL